MGSYQQSLAEAGQTETVLGDPPHWRGESGAASVPVSTHVSGGSSLLVFLSGVGVFLAAMTIALGAELLLRRLLSSPAAGVPAFHTLDGLAGRATLAVAAAVGTVAVAWWERRAVADYGFTSSHPGRNLVGGSLTGLALLSALVLFLHQMDLLVFRGQVLFGTAAEWRFALRSAVVCGAAAFVAEGILRGYLQYALTRALASLMGREGAARRVPVAFWTAAFLLSVGFAVLQQRVVGGSHLLLLNAVLFSLLMAFSLWRTGSLWWAMGYHAAWDWAQSFLWGVPAGGLRAQHSWFLTEAAGSALRSGGSVGPYGSAYTAGALAAGLAILLLLHRSRVYPDLWADTSRRTG